MKYFVTTIASLLATIVAARGGEKAPPAATDDGNIMSRVLALEKIVEEQRVQLEDVHDIVSSLHSRRTQTDECFETEDKIVTIKCHVSMKKTLLVSRKLVVHKEFIVKGNSMFEGGNVFITNGEDNIYEMNGKGNLIVGGKSADVEANPGSHNVIIGLDNRYHSHGGLVTGYRNELFGHYASITGGSYNIASGDYSSISGGYFNQATGSGSSVSGGGYNKATGHESSVSGGYLNKASGGFTSITGGKKNKAVGLVSSIGGGYKNLTPYEGSTVTGTRVKETKKKYQNLP